MSNYWQNFFGTSADLGASLVDNAKSASIALTKTDIENIRAVEISKLMLTLMGWFLLLSAGQAIIEYFSLNQMWLILAIALERNFVKNSVFDKIQYAAIVAVVVFGQYIAMFVFSGEVGTASYHYFGFKFNNLIAIVYVVFWAYMRHHLALIATKVKDALLMKKKTIIVKGYRE